LASARPPLPFRELFKPRVFDYLGKIELDGTSEWYTKRLRFASSVPLEHVEVVFTGTSIEHIDLGHGLGSPIPRSASGLKPGFTNAPPDRRDSTPSHQGSAAQGTNHST
jgi:hypothetical protein